MSAARTLFEGCSWPLRLPGVIQRHPVVLALLVACAPTAPLDTLVGTWCPIDSLTRYVVESPLGVPTFSYVAGSATARYALTFDGRGNVRATGSYVGTFVAPDSSRSVSHFVLPLAGVLGHYTLREVYIRFGWPTPEAGPTWFWEVARHPLTTTGGWATQLDDNEGAWRVFLRFVWERC